MDKNYKRKIIERCETKKGMNINFRGMKTIFMEDMISKESTKCEQDFQNLKRSRAWEEGWYTED